MPSGCTFWQRAQQGQSFYTVPSDHYNCAVGAYSHKIALPAERDAELGQTIGFMVQNNYLSMSEVPGIPTLKDSPNVIAYGPVEMTFWSGTTSIVAEVNVFSLNTRKTMKKPSTTKTSATMTTGNGTFDHEKRWSSEERTKVPINTINAST